jgi:hypothetical protein
MSRGFGRIQYKLLRTMRGGGYFTVDDLARAAYEHKSARVSAADAPSHAELTSVRRALAGLKRHGRVFQVGRRWTRDADRMHDDVIRLGHYLGPTQPTRPILRYSFDGARLTFSLPSNPNISTWLLGEKGRVIELARMYVPPEHRRKNLLSEALSKATAEIKREFPAYHAIITYSDPHCGHFGYALKAASWVALGHANETRYYRAPDGTPVSRRKFHSGSKNHDTKAEIAAAGYIEERRAPTLRFAFPLTRSARKVIEQKRAELHQ